MNEAARQIDAQVLRQLTPEAEAELDLLTEALSRRLVRWIIDHNLDDMHPSKRKGNAFERELVNQARVAGVPAQRARGSDGRALGESSEVDVLLGGGPGVDPLRVQAKRRKAVARYLNPPEGTDLVILREDRGQALAVVPFALLLDLLKRESHA